MASDNPNEFYIHLASTSSLDTYPQNKCHDFTNVLPAEIRLNSRSYECALTQISYTSYFYNVEKTCSLAIFDWLYFWKKDKRWGKLYDVPLSEGLYKDPEVLCSHLNELIANANIGQLKSKNIISYHPFKKKFSVDIDGLWLSLIFHNKLIDLMGFEATHYIKNQWCVIGRPKSGQSYIYDDGKGHTEKRYFYNGEIDWKTDSLHGGLCPFVSQLAPVSSMLIYSSLLSDVIYGNQYTNLIRTCPIEGDLEGQRIVRDFSNRMYFPVRIQTFREITMKVFDSSGAYLNFLSGNFSCILHFKRKY